MQHKDTCRSWVVAFCTSAVVMIEIGTIKSLGILLPDIREDFASYTWVIGLSIAFTSGFASFACLVTGGLSKYLSPRTIVCICGVFSSLGLLIASSSTNVLLFMASFILTGFVGGSVTVTLGTLKTYFDKYYSIAYSMVTCGVSLGIMISPPLTQLLLDIYGWRGTTRLISGICLQAVVCGALIKPVKSKPTISTRSSKKQKECVWREVKNIFDVSLFYNFHFVCMIFIAIGSGYYTTGWLIYAVPYASDVGLDPYEASSIATTGGIGNLFGSLIYPFLCKFMSSKTQLYIGEIGVSVTVILSVLASTLGSYTWMIVCSILFGVCRGILSVVWLAILNEVIEEKQMVNAVGWTWAVYGGSSIVSGFLSGWLYDKFQSYAASFLMLSFVSFLALVPTLAHDMMQILTSGK